MHTINLPDPLYQRRNVPMTAQDYLWARHAIVTKTIRPHFVGQVKYRGTWWNAVCKQNQTLPVGTIVYVVTDSQLPIVVEPMTPPGD
jgi:membrane protein implicated in regulation of membrane protease activity